MKRTINMNLTLTLVAVLYSTLAAQTPQAEFAAPANPKNGFALKFTLNLKTFDGEENILEIPHVLSVRLRQHDPRDRRRQNYPAFTMHDGSVPVLEANIVLHSIEHPDWTNMTIGIPLAMLKNPAGEHEVVLNFSGVRWTMFIDGQLLDNDFPFGYPQWAERNTWTTDSAYVENATVHFPAITPEQKQSQKSYTASMQYWTPPGHNSWVGDVATFFYQGRYHVFYLYDRRHHASKFGQGRILSSNTSPQPISKHGPNTKRQRLSKNNGNASVLAHRLSSTIGYVSAMAYTPGAFIRRTRQPGLHSGNI